MNPHTIDRLDRLVIDFDPGDQELYEAIQFLRRVAALPQELRSEAINIRAIAATERNVGRVTWTQIDAARERANFLDTLANRIEGR